MKDEVEKRRVGLYREREQRWKEKQAPEEDTAEEVKENIEIEKELDDKINEPNTNTAFTDDTTEFYKTVDEEIDKWMDDIVNEREGRVHIIPDVIDKCAIAAPSVHQYKSR